MSEETYTGSEGFGSYLMHAWNAFRNKDPIRQDVGRKSEPNSMGYYPGYFSYVHPDHRYMSPGTDKTLVAAIYNRIATDASMAILRHIRVDDNGMFQEELKTGLNNVLNVSANIDQTGRAFVMDIVLSMLDEGVVAAVPIDTTIDPNNGNSFDIITMRAGKVIGWKPYSVSLEVYNENLGRREQIDMAKSAVAIIENPFYHVMNEPNSIAKRLTRKLSLMDAIDDDIANKKMDVIIQLPYVVKNQTKREQAEERRKHLEDQMVNSKLGVGYIDGTERVIQLNRPMENNLMGQIEYLTSTLYSQLGMTPEIMNGTADEAIMTNYYKRTIDVILQAICDEFERKFLTKTARTQKQAIQFYREPFGLTPTAAIADIADKFTRNEILAPNEIRSIVGFLPSNDEAANELRNRNISQPNTSKETPLASAGGGEHRAGIVDDMADESGKVSLKDLFAR